MTEKQFKISQSLIFSLIGILILVFGWIGTYAVNSYKIEDNCERVEKVEEKIEDLDVIRNNVEKIVNFIEEYTKEHKYD